MADLPLYARALNAAAHKLLWWLVAHMDEEGRVAGNWRTDAAADMGTNRVTIHRAGDRLAREGVIEIAKKPKSVRVLRRVFEL